MSDYGSMENPQAEAKLRFPRGDDMSASRSTGNDGEGDTSSNSSVNLKYAASQLAKVLLPVLISILLVVATALSWDDDLKRINSRGQMFQLTPTAAQDGGMANEAMTVFKNVATMMACLVASTLLLVLAYYYRWYKLIGAWLMGTTFLLMSLFGYLHLLRSARSIDLFVVDQVTVCFALWNLCATGLVAIHWKAPILLRQAYLVLTSCMVSLSLLVLLPLKTAWAVLACLAVWDLIAVLTPCGPLKCLVDISQRRKEELFPALIYSSAIAKMALRNRRRAGRSRTSPSQDDGGQDSESTENLLRDDPNNANPGNLDPGTGPVGPENDPQSDSRGQGDDDDGNNEGRGGVKLGMGDFIFYSLLAGLSSLYGDALATFVTVYLIIVGLTVTLIALAVYSKPLPALPLSVVLGISGHFLTHHIASPLQSTMGYYQLFA